MVTDNTLISELNDLAGQVPKLKVIDFDIYWDWDLYNWTDYSSFTSSGEASYKYYQDIDYDNDGIYDYRGVYSVAGLSDYSELSSYTSGTIYWFRYEPIEWDILTESEGKALVVTDLVLDSRE